MTTVSVPRSWGKHVRSSGIGWERSRSAVLSFAERLIERATSLAWPGDATRCGNSIQSSQGFSCWREVWRSGQASWQAWRDCGLKGGKRGIRVRIAHLPRRDLDIGRYWGVHGGEPRGFDSVFWSLGMNVSTRNSSSLRRGSPEPCRGFLWRIVSVQ
jgi:hypothetical protein